MTSTQQNIKTIYFVLMLSTCFLLKAQAEEFVKKNSKTVIMQIPFQLRLSSMKEEPDYRGTDIRNIYTVKIDFKEEQQRNNSRFCILYYVDGVLTEIFKDQSLPLSLKRNFKGLASGEHEIKIDIENGNDEVWASQTITINVVH